MPLWNYQKKMSDENFRWHELKQILTFCGLMFGLSLICGLYIRASQSEDPTPQVVFSVIFAVLVIYFLNVFFTDIEPVLRFKIPTPRILIEFVFALLFCLAFVQVYFHLLSLAGIPTLQISSSFAKAHWPIWTIFVFHAMMPGFFEELAFRGVIQTKLESFMSGRDAVTVQAALFSVLHISPVIFVSHFAMGLLVGWMRRQSGTIYYGMLLHMAWNGFWIYRELIGVHTGIS